MGRVPIVAFDELDSTNSEARRRGDAGDWGPMWLTASRQSAGRGRRGRNWETGPGNLAATYFSATNCGATELAQYSFIAALAVADLASMFVPASIVSVKWPNDVLLAGRKTAGILIESSVRPQGGFWVAVGIGVNIFSAPEGAFYPATCFGEHMWGAPPSPFLALEKLSDCFEHWRFFRERAGFGAIIDAWRRRAHGLGEPCTARLPNETLEGIAEDIEPDGALRLRVGPDQVRRISAGDVFFGAV